MNSSGKETTFILVGSQLLAIQYASAVTWDQEPYSKGQRFTDSAGNMTSTVVEVDPFGGETNRSANSSFQPQKYTSYTRDSDLSDEAMNRRYSFTLARYTQPDPYDGSYSLSDPQSFNRYTYVQNDPVNFTDPSGLQENQACGADQSFAACYGNGGFWGGGSAGGYGWTSDPHPGQGIIQAAEPRRVTFIYDFGENLLDIYGFVGLFICVIVVWFLWTKTV